MFDFVAKLSQKVRMLLFNSSSTNNDVFMRTHPIGQVNCYLLLNKKFLFTSYYVPNVPFTMSIDIVNDFCLISILLFE